MIFKHIAKCSASFKIKEVQIKLGFPGGSDSKESACSAGDLGLIPGMGRSPGEGIGNPLQFSWARLVAQMVKNQSAMRETWVQSLGWENHLGEGAYQPTSIFLPGKTHGQRSLAGYTRTQLSA